MQKKDFCFHYIDESSMSFLSVAMCGIYLLRDATNISGPNVKGKKKTRI